MWYGEVRCDKATGNMKWFTTTRSVKVWSKVQPDCYEWRYKGLRWRRIKNSSRSSNDSRSRRTRTRTRTRTRSLRREESPMLALASISTGSLPGVRAPITPPAMHMYMYICLDVCVCLDVCICMYMCVYMCVYMCIYVCICVCKCL